VSKEELLEENKDLKTKVFLLKEENAQLKKMIFGAKRERFVADQNVQQGNLFGEVSASENNPETEEETI